MPNTHVPAAGEAMPAAKPTIIGRFSGRPILGDVQMAAAALRIEQDADSIATALAIIHGGEYLVMINHEAEFVMVVRS